MANTGAIDLEQLRTWIVEGISTSTMQQRLAEGGVVCSIELVRLRARQVRLAAAGTPPAPPKARRDSTTARRRVLLAEAVAKVEELKAGLDAALDGWAGTFEGTARYERWSDAVATLESVLDDLDGLDVSW